MLTPSLHRVPGQDSDVPPPSTLPSEGRGVLRDKDDRCPGPSEGVGLESLVPLGTVGNGTTVLSLDFCPTPVKETSEALHSSYPRGKGYVRPSLVHGDRFCGGVTVGGGGDGCPRPRESHSFTPCGSQYCRGSPPSHSPPQTLTVLASTHVCDRLYHSYTVTDIWNR